MERRTSADSDGKGSTIPEGDSSKRAGSAKREQDPALKSLAAKSLSGVSGNFTLARTRRPPFMTKPI